MNAEPTSSNAEATSSNAEATSSDSKLQRKNSGRRRGPLIAGSVIAAAGLVLGGVAAASATVPGQGPASDPTPAPNAAPPTNGDAIPNVTTVEDQIEAYYGSVAGTVPGIGAVTLPSPTSNYAKQVAGIEQRTQAYLQRAFATSGHQAGKPTLVLDIDDTSLNTYDYEVADQFGYTTASWDSFADASAFPAVFGMPQLADWAGTHGYTVIFITGRSDSQRAATVANLSKVGFTVPTDPSHLYMEQTPEPSYLTCGSSCTTDQYKAGTRAHITSLGYRIVADMGDQNSDLDGGDAGLQVKMPNPMYYIP
jgi:HAD superfamily, subfamily IIIB (Acid phosphatase)